MTSRRLLKAASAIREVVGMAILAEIQDPRVRNVTVTSVEVMPDMKQAKVNVSIMGDEKAQRLALHGLQSSAGFLQHKISERIETRYTPKLEFVLDPGVKNSLKIAGILKEVLPSDENEAAADVEAAEDLPADDEDESPDSADE